MKLAILLLTFVICLTISPCKQQSKESVLIKEEPDEEATAAEDSDIVIEKLVCFYFVK